MSYCINMNFWHNYTMKTKEKVIEKPGGFKRRLIALTLDNFIMPFFFIAGFFVSILLSMVLGFVFGSFLPEGESVIDSLMVIVAIVGSFFVYHVWMVSKYGGTPGMLICNLYIVNAEKKNITILQALLRNFAKIVSAIPLYLGFLWVIWDPEKRAWHDYIAKTYVVVKR